MWMTRESRLIKLWYRRAESLACLLLILTSAFAAVSLLPEVKAETVVIEMTPNLGNIGTTIHLGANITSANGTYQILWDGLVLVSNASAVGNAVNASFTVPPSTSGSHTVMVFDVAKGENATSNFTVSTAYSVDVLPELAPPTQRQEGDAFQIFLNMTGGEQGKTNAANITVKAPNNASYTSLGAITTGNDGNGTLVVDYPGDFSAGANTNLMGEYGIFFNDTLASGASLVVLTNSSEYHRNQAVDIKAVYAPGENVTLAITGTDLNCSESLKADVDGIVHYVNSTILSNASIGIYTVNVTSVSGPTRKDPPDFQSFTVPGFNVSIMTKNLAKEPVQNATLEIYQNLNSLYNMTANVGGLANLTLEAGGYVCHAFIRDQDVGTLAFEVNETSTAFDLYCNLTNFRVTVADEDGVLIPDVELALGEGNQTSTADVNPTDINGTSVIHSLLPMLNNVPIDYTLNASRYGTQFNATAFLHMPIADYFDLRIVCPKMDLQINVTNANGQPISNAIVNASELKGGLFYSNITSASGIVTMHSTLGRYLIQVYANGIQLNETIVDLNETTVNNTIICGLYGLDVSVRVVDYFGQPIPNVNVTLQRTGYQSSGLSGADGLVPFSSIVGGKLELAVRFVGQSEPFVATTTFVDKTTTVEIRIDQYVMLAGMLVETGQLVTVIMVVLAVVFVLCLEVYRRRRHRPRENES